MLKALMLRKKINDKKKEIEALRAATADFEAREAELKKREAEIAESIEEASTEEEQAVVAEAVDSYEADDKALKDEKSENDQKIADLENEVEAMEAELAKVEEQQRAAAPVAAPETPVVINHEGTIIKSEERTNNHMFKTRSINIMTMEQRAALVAREDVQKTLSEIRTLIKEKRTVTGSEVFIGETVFDLIRENLIEYSKLYSRVRASFTKQNGRQPVEGAIPEAIWLECCDALQELDISFGSVELDCYKVGGFFAVCNARIEDADIDLLDVFTDALLAAIGMALDKAFIYGTGTKMPTGVVTALADATTGIPGNLVTIPASAEGIALFKALILAGGKADGKYSRGRKTWICNETTRTKLVAEGLEVTAAGTIVSAVEGSMPVDGGDLIVLNSLPDNNIVVGYWDLYAALIKKGMTTSVSTEYKFVEDQTVLKGVMRADGKPVIKGAFVAIGLGAAPTTSVPFPGQNSEDEDEGGEG